MTAIHLRGLAERADCAEMPLGPDVIVPETVSVYLEFDLKNGPVGIAKLRRDEHGIWADVTLELNGGTMATDLLRKVATQGNLRKLWPTFAIGVAHAVVTPDDEHPAGVVTAGEVANMSLCRANCDPDLPPYEIVNGVIPAEELPA